MSADVGARHTHLFICGLHRGGTSALHEILKTHPLMTGFSGTGKPKDEGQHLQTVLGRDGDYGGPGDFCFNPAAHLTEADIPAYRERLPELFASWGQLWAPDRPIRVEKSPPNLIRSRFLQAAFEDAPQISLSITTRVISRRRQASHWMLANGVCWNASATLSPRPSPVSMASSGGDG